MSKFVIDMKFVDVPRQMRHDLAEVLGPQLHTCFRAGAGRLRGLLLQGRPFLPLLLGILQSKSASAVGYDLSSLNKFTRDAQCSRCRRVHTAIPSSLVREGSA